MKFQILKDKYSLNGEVYAINSVVDLSAEVGTRLEVNGDVKVWHGKVPVISKESRELVEKPVAEVKTEDVQKPIKKSLVTRIKEGVKKK